MDKVRQWLYYCIIGVVSFLSLTFLPMIGSEVGLGWNLPNTTVGWVVWVAAKLIVSGLNVLLFYCFMQQAKLNIKDNAHYKEARDILLKQDEKEAIPKSPKKWSFIQYRNKGTAIFITTGLSTMALTQAILTFDYISMLTYLFTIAMGIVFGIIQMKSAEEYWTDEYYRYALMVQEQNKNKEKENDNDRRERVQKPGRAGEEKPDRYRENHIKQ